MDKNLSYPATKPCYDPALGIGRRRIMKIRDMRRVLWKVFNWSVGMSALNGLALYLHDIIPKMTIFLVVLWGTLLSAIFFSGMLLLMLETIYLFKNRNVYAILIATIVVFVEIGILVMIFVNI